MILPSSCVTGASRGIGAEVTLTLANLGYTVLGLARNVGKIDELALRVGDDNGGKIISRHCDVENESEILSAFNWVTKII